MDGCEEGNLKRKMHAQRKILQLQPFQILKMQIFLHCSIWTWFCDGIGCTFFLYFTWPFHKIQFERTSQGKYQGNPHFHNVWKLPKMYHEFEIEILSLVQRNRKLYVNWDFAQNQPVKIRLEEIENSKMAQIDHKT